MACLRESSIEGRSGNVQCDAEGCEFRLFPHPDDSDAATRTQAADHFLQLQLRAGSPENSSGVCPIWRHDSVSYRDGDWYQDDDGRIWEYGYDIDQAIERWFEVDPQYYRPSGREVERRK